MSQKKLEQVLRNHPWLQKLEERGRDVCAEYISQNKDNQPLELLVRVVSNMRDEQLIRVLSVFEKNESEFRCLGNKYDACAAEVDWDPSWNYNNNAATYYYRELHLIRGAIAALIAGDYKCQVIYKFVNAQVIADATK